MYELNLIHDQDSKERLSRVIILTHDFTWNSIVKTDKGFNLAVIAKDAIFISIQDIIAEVSAVPHEILKETASKILEEDWNYDIGQHAAAKLVIMRRLQISGIRFSKELYDSRFWMTLACQEFSKLYQADDEEYSPIYGLLNRAANDLDDSESKQLILSRSDKEDIQKRALKIIRKITAQYATNQACNYAQTLYIQENEEGQANFAAA